MTEFTTKTGATVVINPAPFDDAIDLKSAIQRELAKTQLKFDMSMLKDVDAEVDVAPLINAAMTVDSSKEVNAALFKCLGRCTYNSQKIVKATFEPVEARSDYYEVIGACMKENVGPFFSGLASLLGGLMARLPQNPKAGNSPA